MKNIIDQMEKMIPLSHYLPDEYLDREITLAKAISDVKILNAMGVAFGDHPDNITLLSIQEKSKEIELGKSWINSVQELDEKSIHQLSLAMLNKGFVLHGICLAKKA